MQTRRFLAGVLLLVLILPGAAGSLAVGGQEEEKAEEEAQAELPKPLVIPEEEKQRKNAVEATTESVEAGRKLFTSQCAMCHGEKGDGKGELAQEAKLTPPDFTEPETRKKRTDGELFYILTTGHGAMPGQGERMREVQKWHLINFIRSLAPAQKPADKPAE
ncbi:MAG: cytochrome c [Acidobacteria bacterium]|nr:cytochrome c [Acidobacteriota bacterium]